MHTLYHVIESFLRYFLRNRQSYEFNTSKEGKQAYSDQYLTVCGYSSECFDGDQAEPIHRSYSLSNPVQEINAIRHSHSLTQMPTYADARSSANETDICTYYQECELCQLEHQTGKRTLFCTETRDLSTMDKSSDTNAHTTRRKRGRDSSVSGSSINNPARATKKSSSNKSNRPRQHSPSKALHTRPSTGGKNHTGSPLSAAQSHHRLGQPLASAFNVPSRLMKSFSNILSVDRSPKPVEYSLLKSDPNPSIEVVQSSKRSSNDLHSRLMIDSKEQKSQEMYKTKSLPDAGVRSLTESPEIKISKKEKSTDEKMVKKHTRRISTLETVKEHQSEQDSATSDSTSSPSVSNCEIPETSNKKDKKSATTTIFSWKNLKNLNFPYKSLKLFPVSSKRRLSLMLNNNKEHSLTPSSAVESTPNDEHIITMEVKTEFTMTKASSAPDISIPNFEKDWFYSSEVDEFSQCSASESYSGVSDVISDDESGKIPDDLSSIFNADEKDKVLLFSKYMKKKRNDSRFKFFLYDDDDDDSEDTSDEFAAQRSSDFYCRRRKKTHQSLSESSAETVILSSCLRVSTIAQSGNIVDGAVSPSSTSLTPACGASFPITPDIITCSDVADQQRSSVLCFTPGSLPDINLIPCTPKFMDLSLISDTENTPTDEDIPVNCFGAFELEPDRISIATYQEDCAITGDSEYVLI